MRHVVILASLLSFVGYASAASAAPASAAAAPASATPNSCPPPHTPGAHLCSLVIQSIGIEGSGPETSAELVANVAGSTPRCYHAPAPGTMPNVAGMTRRLLKSWRGHKPILLDSYYPEDKSQGCEWLVRDAMPCPPDHPQTDPPCLLHPTVSRFGSEPVAVRKPAAALSEGCEGPRQDTQFCSGFISSIEPVKDSDRMTVRLAKPDICVTIDPAADQTNLKIWQAKLELARAAKEEHVQAIVLFPTVPELPAGACPALYQIDIQ